jgi:hypothetical protein
MTVRILRATLPAWYADRIGECLEVCPEPYKYAGGLGYMCIDHEGGVLVRDCEVIGVETGKRRPRKGK